jgi:hypothetical protein
MKPKYPKMEMYHIKYVSNNDIPRILRDKYIELEPFMAGDWGGPRPTRKNKKINNYRSTIGLLCEILNNFSVKQYSGCSGPPINTIVSMLDWLAEVCGGFKTPLECLSTKTCFNLHLY